MTQHKNHKEHLKFQEAADTIRLEVNKLPKAQVKKSLVENGMNLAERLHPADPLLALAVTLGCGILARDWEVATGETLETE